MIGQAPLANQLTDFRAFLVLQLTTFSSAVPHTAVFRPRSKRLYAPAPKLKSTVYASTLGAGCSGL